jgi:predicted nucleic acid-binding protein
VLTDDRDARRVAQAIGVDLSGALGALVNLVDQGTLSIAQADELLAEMQRHGYHSPVNSLSELEDG